MLVTRNQVQWRLVLGSLFPPPKADLYWILAPITHGRLVLDSRPINQGRLVLDPLSHYPMQTCTGFLVPITQARLELDSLSHYLRLTCTGSHYLYWIPLPKADLYWITCSYYPRRTCMDSCPITQGRLVLDSSSNY